MSQRALIIGGGIGGLSTGLALLRFGWDVAVYESAPELRPVGKGIWVPTNAMQVFDRLGIAGRVAAHGIPLDAIRIQTRTGTDLTEIDLCSVQSTYGHTTISTKRAALIGVIADALPPGTLHLGKRFRSFTQDQTRVVARFEDGTEAAGDLLIGADGMRSRVGEQLRPGV